MLGDNYFPNPNRPDFKGEWDAVATYSFLPPEAGEMEPEQVAMQQSGSPLNAVNRISPVGSKKRGRPRAER